MKRFDYIIVTNMNEWVSTGNQETEEQLQETLELLREDYLNREFIVYRADVLDKKTY